MSTISPGKAGLAFGLLIGAWHALWSTLVAFGFAQALIDLVFWLHFIRPPFVVEPFEPVRALLLVSATTAVGYAIGYVLARIWNALGR